MAEHRPAAGVSVTISAGTHARVVLACEALNLTVSEFMDRAARASLLGPVTAKLCDLAIWF